MSGRLPESTRRLLRLLAHSLDSYLEGEDLAFETLGEQLDEEGVTLEDLRSAALVLRDLSGEAAPVEVGEAAVEGAPGRNAQRVWSAEERASLSPEAWGYLIALRGRGSLDAAQFERVLELLTGCGVRPVPVDLARDVATRVALEVDPDGGPGDPPDGDFDLAH